MKTVSTEPTFLSFMTAAIILATYVIGIAQYSMSKSSIIQPSSQTVVTPTVSYGETTETVSTAPEINYDIIPGKSVGDITTSTTEEDLKQLFGIENIQNGDIAVGEGNSQRGTIVFANEPDKRLEILWKDEVNHKNPASIRIEGGTSNWQLPGGVSLGTTLSDLETKNGNPFKLLGFNWDYGGTITSWESGKLKDYVSSKYQVFLTLSYPNNTRLTGKELAAINGDQEIYSSNPILHRVNPKISSVIISFMEVLPEKEESPVIPAVSEEVESQATTQNPEPPIPAAPQPIVPTSSTVAPTIPQLDPTPPQATQNPDETEEKEVPGYLKKYVE